MLWNPMEFISPLLYLATAFVTFVISSLWINHRTSKHHTQVSTNSRPQLFHQLGFFLHQHDFLTLECPGSQSNSFLFYLHLLPWWYHLVHGFKHHLYARDSQIYVQSLSHIELKTWNPLAYLLSLLGYINTSNTSPINLTPSVFSISVDGNSTSQLLRPKSLGAIVSCTSSHTSHLV